MGAFCSDFLNSKKTLTTENDGVRGEKLSNQKVSSALSATSAVINDFYDSGHIDTQANSPINI
jgi:hypothetical protein